MKICVRDVFYHVEIYGKGEPIVFLHGFTGDVTTWYVCKKIFPNHQLIFVDLIGHGKTESPLDMTRYRMDEVVQDLREMMGKLQIEQTHLVGYSMGGRVALSFAITYPQCIKTLILESSSPGLKTEAEREERKKADEKLANYILENGMETFVNYWENIPLFQSQKILPSKIKEKIRKQRLQNNPIGLANSLIGMGTGVQPSWWGAPLQRISAPMLLICGELDKKFCQMAKEMERFIPIARTHIVPSAGHAIHVEQPRIFGKIVSEFLQSFGANEDRKRIQKEDENGH
jgi:2-succinyl-6-hydroxy-2,4-cyclohexadiene-1-carboxylate synthase